MHVIVSYRIFWINKSGNQDADSDTWSLENCAHEVGSSALYNRLQCSVCNICTTFTVGSYLCCVALSAAGHYSLQKARLRHGFTIMLHSDCTRLAIVDRSSRIAVHHEYSFEVEQIEHAVIVITATANWKTRIPFFLSWLISLHPLSFPIAAAACSL